MGEAVRKGMALLSEPFNGKAGGKSSRPAATDCHQYSTRFYHGSSLLSSSEQEQFKQSTLLLAFSPWTETSVSQNPSEV